MGLRFEWNAVKAERNLVKHGISFEEAATVLSDTLSITIGDSNHSTEEQRFVTIGQSSSRRLLVVVHTDRDDRIRLDSARRATRSEKRQYFEDG